MVQIRERISGKKKRNAPHSIIPYIGGKYGLVSRIIPLIKWCAESYELAGLIEGAAGGARIMLNTSPDLFEHRILNDLDLSLAKLYAAIGDKELVYQLIKRLNELEYSKEVFDTAVLDRDLDAELADRRIYKGTSSIVNAAAYTFICAHQSHAANMKGYDRGREARCYSDYYDKVDCLDAFQPLLEGVTVTHGSCLDLVDEYYDRGEYFMYIDMPYPEKTMRGGNHYKYNCTHEVLEELANKLINTKMKIALSSYPCDIYDRLCDQHGWQRLFLKMKSVTMGGTASLKGAECLYINFEIPFELEDSITSGCLW
ncbi:DNA adenine methylase [Paenibacillus donghaensis]|uniref:Site-specific DNA-methyltransferase (adenine-specific) n=1 Tax=Paenibacillus donghaensis TaxID=414771 RepID=A0A2Z2KHB0_9BACL|nr:DNA adenine methylase [Paenibacillus donghaensis]ASA25624.1 hypothetical protein B9T62_35765 [Paenibacillus donghaensis]